MVDLAVEWRRQGGQSWFVVPRPRNRFVNGVGRPTVLELLQAFPREEMPVVATPGVGAEFEFGTQAYRAGVYARAAKSFLPLGVPVIVSDDPSCWSAGASIADRNPVVGVLHADEDRYYRLASRHAESVAALISVSKRIQERAMALVDGARDEASRATAVIPCGTVLPDRSAKPQSSDGRLRLIWLGRVDEHQKRVSDLARIGARLNDLGFGFTLTVIGDGPERNSLQEAFVQAGISQLIRMLGWQPSSEVHQVLVGSDVLLLPSNFEGMPIAVMEALARGCGIVASRVSGLEDYERHPLAQDCLWLHAVGDVGAAANQIINAARVSNEERASRARLLAEAEFSISTCAQRYAGVLAMLSSISFRAGVPLPARLGAAPWLSYPVAATRIARLWLSGRYRRKPGALMAVPS